MTDLEKSIKPKKRNVTEAICGINGEGGKYYDKLQKACYVVGIKKKELDKEECKNEIM